MTREHISGKSGRRRGRGQIHNTRRSELSVKRVELARVRCQMYLESWVAMVEVAKSMKEKEGEAWEVCCRTVVRRSYVGVVVEMATNLTRIHNKETERQFPRHCLHLMTMMAL